MTQKNSRKLKHVNFLHLWSLPVLARELLPNAGETTMAFPKFPDASPLVNKSSITEDKYLYYYLKRESVESGTKFTTGSIGTKSAHWVLLFSKSGKFESLTRARRLTIVPATQAEFDAFVKDEKSGQ